jgi:hypothetical protein
MTNQNQIELDVSSPIADVLSVEAVALSPDGTDEVGGAVRVSMYETRTGEQYTVAIPYDAACHAFELWSKALAVLHG